MRQVKQLSFLKDPRKDTKLWWIQMQNAYGGSLNYRKVERPFDSKKLIHVVFKARVGKGLWFTRSRTSIEGLIKKLGKRYGVVIKDMAVNKDHIHILLYTKKRESLLCFLRLFSAEMGRKYKVLFKRFGLKKPNPLWVHRPFTRLVDWGKTSLERIKRYIRKNHEEAMGFIAYQPRRHRLSLFLQKWQRAMAQPLDTT